MTNSELEAAAEEWAENQLGLKPGVQTMNLTTLRKETFIAGAKSRDVELDRLKHEDERNQTRLIRQSELWAEEVSGLRTEIARLREALEEMAKPPWPDSDLKSLMEWVNSRARAALERETDRQSGEQEGK